MSESYDPFEDVEKTEPSYEVIMLHRPRELGGQGRVAMTWTYPDLAVIRKAAETWITQAPAGELRKAVVRVTQIYATYVPEDRRRRKPA